MCIARLDTVSRHFQGPRKYGIYQYLQGIFFHRLNNILFDWHAAGQVIKNVVVQIILLLLGQLLLL